MTVEALEARVALLEQQVSQLMVGKSDRGAPERDAWKQSVGMFRGDPVFKEMLDEAQRMRDESRRTAQEAAGPMPE